MSSFPVPVSPRTRTVESVGATRSTCASTASKAGLPPIICSNLRSFESNSLYSICCKAPTEPPGKSVELRFPSAQLLMAARTLSSRISSSNGFDRNSTAPARKACSRIFSSPCPVINMMGMLQCSAFSLACSSRPDIPGIRISAMTHPVCCLWSKARKSSAEAKSCAGRPISFMRPRRALRIDSSSSTMTTIFVFSAVAMIQSYRDCTSGAIMPWYNAVAEPILRAYTMLTGGFHGLRCDLWWSLLAQRKIELFSHSYQISQRVSVHLLHHSAAMHLDGDFSRAQFSGDLLVEHARDYERHNFALAGRQTSVAASQFRSQTLLFTPGAVAIE